MTISTVTTLAKTPVKVCVDPANVYRILES